MKRLSLVFAALLVACAVPGSPTTYGKPLGAYVPGELVVRWTAEADQPAVLARLGLIHLDGDGLTQRLGVPRGQELELAARLTQQLGVAVAEPNFVKRTQQAPGGFKLMLTPPDPAWPSMDIPVKGQAALWGIKAIRADQAWDVTAGSPDVEVATIDTGADMTHLGLAANLDAKNSLNLVERGSVVDDDFGHGTHVAGIIAATSDAAGMLGVAWKTRVMPIRVLGVDGTGSSYDTVSAIEYAVAHKARVINMSLGSPDHSEVEADAIAAAVAANVVVVAASGNEAVDGNYLEYPASYPGVVSVGAIGPDKKRAPFSNYNSFVTVCAPGVDILSTIPTRMNPSEPYGYLSGTSMASPMVAGVAALVIAAHPGWTAAQVIKQLRVTAQDLNPTTDDPGGYDIFFGSGLVNAAAAVR
ncbi:MAG: Thermophilic serine proteinase precursor [Cyanobacteria bacterium RYN_339]|nr:Thermophilic serine proteinase precursor [Cyanobacteria bacterium RYN_339]